MSQAEEAKATAPCSKVPSEYGRIAGYKTSSTPPTASATAPRRTLAGGTVPRSEPKILGPSITRRG